MKGIVLTAALAVAIATPAHAQFGWSVTFDPTQATHVISQIAQAEKTYTQTVQTTENVINTYNLAKRMATSPASLYSGYGSGLPTWVPVLPSNDTYGNTGTWIKSVNQNLGTASSAIQGASVSRVAQLSGYQNLDAASQRALAAQFATVDLGDAVNATNLSAVGAVRANQTQRRTDIANLEAASHSQDASERTELATLQRINQALLLLLRTQQDQSQLAQGQTLQQMVQQKQQQDDIKMAFQVANGYAENYNAKTTTETDAAIAKALH